MLKSVVGILLGIIISLIGVVINLQQNFGTDLFWIGTGLFFTGIGIVVIFVLGKIKKWF